MFSKNDVRVSRTGRPITTPKHVLSTSEEERPKKRQKNYSSVQQKLEELKEFAAAIKKGKTKNTSIVKDSESDVNMKSMKNTSISMKPLSPESKSTLNENRKSNTSKSSSSKPSISNKNNSSSSMKPLSSESKSTLNENRKSNTLKSSSSKSSIINKNNSFSSMKPLSSGSNQTENLNSEGPVTSPSEPSISFHNNNNSSTLVKPLSLEPKLKSTNSGQSNTADSASSRPSTPFAASIALSRKHDGTVSEQNFQNEFEDSNRPLVIYSLDSLSNMDQFETIQEVPVLQFSPESIKNLNMLNDFCERLLKVENVLETLQKQSTRIIQMLELHFGMDQRSDRLYESLTGFPISTVDQFFEVEENNDVLQKIQNHLLMLGGSKLKDFLSCGLKDIMTDELVSKFTWNKTQDTLGIRNTKLFNVFYQAARRCPLFAGPENKEVFKLNMLDVLKSTKQRFRNKTKKGNKLNSTNDLKKQLSELQNLLHNLESNSDNEADGDDEADGGDERGDFDENEVFDDDADDEAD